MTANHQPAQQQPAQQQPTDQPPIRYACRWSDRYMRDDGSWYPTSGVDPADAAARFVAAAESDFALFVGANDGASTTADDRSSIRIDVRDATTRKRVRVTGAPVNVDGLLRLKVRPSRRVGKVNG